MDNASGREGFGGGLGAQCVHFWWLEGSVYLDPPRGGKMMAQHL